MSDVGARGSRLKPGATYHDERFRVDRFLGAGAFAEVYAVTDVALKQPRALKIVWRDAVADGQAWAELLERFETEHELAAAVHAHERGANVIQVFEWRETPEALFAVLELCDGSLAERIQAVRSQGAIPIDEAVRWVREAALGLKAIHEVGAIHRDVKPANILVDGRGRAIVADLGLAQRVMHSRGRSMRGSLGDWHPGTPGYMSPEHAGADALLPTADVYGLGCVAFELLTGRMWHLERAVLEDLRGLRGDVPRELDAMVLRMLRDVPGRMRSDVDDSSKRFPSMVSVIESMQSTQGARGGGLVASGARWHGG